MSGRTPGVDGPPHFQGSKKRRVRSTPLWVLVVIPLLAGPLAIFGVFAIGSYITEHTTVTIDAASWTIPVGGGTEYLLSCGPGVGSCPQDVKPGSDYTTSIFVSGYFAGKSVNLAAPSPFRLLGTEPYLPVPVPPTGLVITVDLGLPSSPGEYSFLGTVTFS
ncbi:MAG: hypothetical protein WCB18_02675 [Thermoplasmata archaeon]